VDIGGLDLGLAEAEPGQQFEGRILELFGRNLEDLGEEIGAQRPFVEGEFDVEGAGQRRLQPIQQVGR
jgi:hypothetical protein